MNKTQISILYRLLKETIIPAGTVNPVERQHFISMSDSGYFRALRNDYPNYTMEIISFLKTNITEKTFLKHYGVNNIIVATEKHIAFINTPPAMKEEHLETLLFLIEKGPIYDGDLPSKSIRDFLVACGFIARIHFNGQEGFNAATYKGRNAFCQHYGVEVLSDAIEQRLYKRMDILNDK